MNDKCSCNKLIDMLTIENNLLKDIISNAASDCNCHMDNECWMQCYQSGQDGLNAAYKLILKKLPITEENMSRIIYGTL